MKFKEYLAQLVSVPNQIASTLKGGGDAVGEAYNQTTAMELSPFAVPLVLAGIGVKTVREVHEIVFDQVTAGMEAAADGLDEVAEWVNEKASKGDCNAGSSDVAAPSDGADSNAADGN